MYNVFFLHCMYCFLTNVFIFKLSHRGFKALSLLILSILDLNHACVPAFVCECEWDSLINSQVFKQPKSCNLLLPISEEIDIFSVLLQETSMGKINCLQPGTGEFRIISTD